MSSVPRREFRYGGDVVISYEVEGSGPTPVVFLHGFAAALTTWDDIRKFFPRDRFCLYFLDLKGSGRSSRPRDGRYAIEDHAAVIIALLEELRLSRTILVGHSLGGGIALLAALQAQSGKEKELIGRLVLVDAAAYPQPLPPIMSLLRTPLLGAAILHLLPVRFMVRFTLEKIFRNRAAITAERVERYVPSFAGKGAAYVYIQTVRQLDPYRYVGLAAAYPTLSLPLLIIWGREDPLIPLAAGIRLQREIPGARLAVIPNCGHVPQEERPAETWHAIADFLDLLTTTH